MVGENQAFARFLCPRALAAIGMLALLPIAIVSAQTNAYVDYEKRIRSAEMVEPPERRGVW